MKRGMSVSKEKRENRGRTERGIYIGKGDILTVIVRWEAVIQTAQGESGKERIKKVYTRRGHRVAP